MNPAHLHLLLNHAPVIGAIGAVLLLAYALLRRSPELTGAGLGVLVLVAVAGIVVYLTGDPAEEVVEDLAGVSETIIESHEEAAMIATIILSAAGVVALAGLITSRRHSTGVPKGFAVSALLLAVASAAAMGYTANLGGMIRHTEIRPDAGAGVEAGGGAAPDGVTRDEGP